MCKLSLILSGLLLATAPAAAVAAPGTNRLPEEITITGQLDPAALRRQLEAAEMQIFELFNEFNSDARYDIECRVEAQTGSRISKRRCLPGFYERAIRAQSLAFMKQLRGEAGDLAVPIISETGRHFPVLEQKMLELIEQEPDLFDAAVGYQTLYLELEASTRGTIDTR